MYMYIHARTLHVYMYMYLSILPSLLHHSMKEGQYVDERFEGSVWAGSLFEGGRGNLEVGVPQVQLQTIRRLSHNFQRFLL